MKKNPPFDSIWTPQKDLLFRIKKYRESYVHGLTAALGIGGFYRLEALKSDGRRYWLTDWFHNNIPDVGLDLCATDTNRYRCCQVGTGTAEPTNEDTGLGNYAAGTGTRVPISTTQQFSESPYYVDSYFRYDFATGAVSGNMSEVAIGPSASDGPNVFSRELIRDSSGDPTTISVTSEEALLVHHRLRLYAPVSDATGSIVASLNGTPTELNYTRRARSAGRTNAWRPRGSSVFYGNEAGNFGEASTNNSAPSVTAYTGGIVAANSADSITGAIRSSDSTLHTQDSYTPGSFNRQRTVTWPVVSPGQPMNNIRSMVFTGSASFLGNFGNDGTSQGAFQVEFDQTFSISDTDIMVVGINIAWQRYIEP